MISAALLLVLAATPTADQVLAQVDAVQITRADLDERLRVLAARRRAAAPRAAVGDLLDEALLAAEARRLGIAKEPAVAAQIEGERRRLAAEAFLRETTPEPSEAQLRELYHATGDSVRLVLVKVASEAEARAALERVRAGGDLADEARRSMDASLASKAGDTGVVSRAALDPAVADAAFKGQVGSVVGPVELKLGWAIAKIVERQVADDAAFPARRAQIAAFARDRIRIEWRAHLLDQLRRRSGVKVDEEFLRGLPKTGARSEKELDHPVAVVNGKPIPYRTIAGSFERIAGAAGHGAGAARISFTWAEVDRRLLEDEAVAKGFDRSPAVTRLLPGIERNLLASVVADRIAGKSADLSDAKVRARLEQLRRAAKVRVDEAAVAALERTP